MRADRRDTISSAGCQGEKSEQGSCSGSRSLDPGTGTGAGSRTYLPTALRSSHSDPSISPHVRWRRMIMLQPSTPSLQPIKIYAQGVSHIRHACRTLNKQAYLEPEVCWFSCLSSMECVSLKVCQPSLWSLSSIYHFAWMNSIILIFSHLSDTEHSRSLGTCEVGADLVHV